MPSKPPQSVETYGIYVGFDQSEDKKEREYLLNLPITFYLPEEEVHKVRKVGPKILDESINYRKLCASLDCWDK